MTGTPFDLHDDVQAMLGRRSRFETTYDRVPFQATNDGENIVLVNSRGNKRTIQLPEFLGVARLYLEGKAERPGQVTGMSHNGSYILALIKASEAGDTLDATRGAWAENQGPEAADLREASRQGFDRAR